MDGTTQSELVEKDKFYQRFSTHIITALTASLLISLAMVGLVLYQITHKPMPTFTAVSLSGQTMRLNPYLEPNLQSQTIIAWARKATVAAYSFDFVNYNTQLGGAKPYFTPDGWIAFQSAMYSVIARVTKSQLIVSGVVTGSPVISNEGTLTEEGYSWRLQLPFLVTYQSSEQTKTEEFVVVLLIVKVPTYINPQGIGIEHFQMFKA
jgi:intracellular multiplication protein IcmL